MVSEPLIISFELGGFIDGTLPCPSSTASSAVGSTNQTTTAASEWMKRDQLLMSWLLASLSEEVLPLVLGLHSSHDVWRTLHQTFGAPSETRILQLQMQLQTLKQGDSTISHYLQQVKFIADQLAAAGHSLSQSHINAIVFNNLHSDFSGIVASLSSCSTPISFPELQSILLSHEIRVQNQRASSTIMPTANYTRTSTTPASSPPTPPFHRNRGRGNGRGRSSQPRHDNCPVCGKAGHSPYRCRYRHPGSLPSEAHAAITSTSPVVPALGEYNEWYPDTGATHHTTPNLDALQTVDNYQGSARVVVGNGSEDSTASAARPN